MIKFFSVFLMFLLSFHAQAQLDVFDASRQGDVEALKKLYAQSPTVINTKTDSGYSPLMLAAYRGKLNAVRFLVDKVKNIDDDSKYGTPLMAAAVKGHTKIAKLLIDHNANVNSKDENGTTALHYAAMFKFYDIASYLIECDARSNIKDIRGNTALDYAKLIKDEKLINLITQK